jgi:hypothetical protein
MPVRRGVHDHLLRLGHQAVLAHIVLAFDMAHDRQGGQVRHAAAADEQTLRVLREAEHVLDPRQRGALDVSGGLVAAGGAGRHGRGEHIAEDADVRRCAVDPREEARTRVAHGVRQHFIVDAF